MGATPVDTTEISNSKGGASMSFVVKNCIDYGYPTKDYIDTCKMPSGQTAKIEFQGDYTKNKYYFNVYLVVMDKRKSESDTTLRCTGKDGLQCLIWAKRKIIEFEEFIREELSGCTAERCKNDPIVIRVHWEDNRRRNAYEYGLKKLGYKFDMIFGKKVLCKTI